MTNLVNVASNIYKAEIHVLCDKYYLTPARFYIFSWRGKKGTAFSFYLKNGLKSTCFGTENDTDLYCDVFPERPCGKKMLGFALMQYDHACIMLCSCFVSSCLNLVLVN